MAKIERLPDGTYWIEEDARELKNIENKIEKNIELDDREDTLAREFQLW